MLETTTDLLRKVISIADSVLQTVGPQEPQQGNTPSSLIKIPALSSPAPLSSKLSSFGLPYDVAEQLNGSYIKRANELKTTTMDVIRTTLAKLTFIPSIHDRPSFERLQHKVFDVHHQRYRTTLTAWEKELMDLACSRLTSASLAVSKPLNTSRPTKKSKRLFKSEYLPLFEFAFEKDRFPNREDKKRLARISNMSYRQVCVWFQNRRCRQASRVRSHRTTPAPKTFEEMKERLGPSAREAMSKPLPFTKKRIPDTADRTTIEEPVVAQGTPRPSPVPEIIGLDDTPSPMSNTRSVYSEATDDGFASDECDELMDDDFLEPLVYQLPTFITTLPQKCNPLNPFRTSVHAFPAFYEPSQLTSDPFVFKHHPWLRDPRTNSRKPTDPTLEAMEDIMGGFDRMDVEPNVKTTDEQLSCRSMQRNVSSESIGMWSSGESTAASRASSYLSSAHSSPRVSKAELPTLSEDTLETEPDAPEVCTFEMSEYAASPEAEDTSETDLDTEAETVCDLPDEESMMAGPSAASLKNQVTPICESSAEERVDTWGLESVTIRTRPPVTNLKWENLLAVAAQATRRH